MALVFYHRASKIRPDNAHYLNGVEKSQDAINGKFFKLFRNRLTEVRVPKIVRVPKLVKVPKRLIFLRCFDDSHDLYTV